MWRGNKEDNDWSNDAQLRNVQTERIRYRYIEIEDENSINKRNTYTKKKSEKKRVTKKEGLEEYTRYKFNSTVTSTSTWRSSEVRK